MTPLKPSEVTDPGIYRWLSAEGINHVGYVSADRAGRLSANFLSDSGILRSISLHADSSDNGYLLGPLELPPVIAPA